MATLNNEDPADPSVHEPRVAGSPDEIWLNYGDIERDCTHAELYRDGDVTWCKDKCFASDVRYVRADLLHGTHEPKPTPQADVALPEPAAWVRSWTGAHLMCVTSLSYRSIAEADAGVQYMPAYTADQMRAYAAAAVATERKHAAR